MGRSARLIDFAIILAVVLFAVSAVIGKAATAQDLVRIALPTKTYFPTIIAETARRHKLFEKEGIKAELTIYRAGAEAFEAVAAGAADLTHGSAAIVAAGLKKGVVTRAVSATQLGYFGWHILVRADSEIENPAMLADKKVGITAAGSASDIVAHWTMESEDIDFVRVPLGGSGLAPNLLSGNVDAICAYSPLSYSLIQSGQARSVLDLGKAVPTHVSGMWIASNDIIEAEPDVVQRTVNALTGAIIYLHQHPEEAIAIIAEINEIDPEIAKLEFEGSIGQLTTGGGLEESLIAKSLDLARMVGMTDLAPASEVYTTAFEPVPTR